MALLKCLYLFTYLSGNDEAHLIAADQGCKQDVKSQDQDETETVNLQDRDETEMFHFSNSQDRDETETFNLQDRDETRRSKKRLETASRPRRKTETFQKTYQDRSVAV